MTETSVLHTELEKLEHAELKRISQLWLLPSFVAKDKKTATQTLIKTFTNEFYLRGVLEKFTSVQVTILVSILKNKNVLTLGEIARKVGIPPINVEMELNVLRKHFLVYQRKNRERLTNNLDKYHAYEEIAKLIHYEANVKGDKFKFSIEKTLSKAKELPQEWKSRLAHKKTEHAELLSYATSEEGLAKLVKSLHDLEKDVLHRIYINGGMIEAEVLRNYIHVNRGKFEVVCPLLNSLHLIKDTYFLEDKFIRVFILPKELLDYMHHHPVLPSIKTTTRQKQEKIVSNDLDFFLNVKKQISYISRKGLNLAKSGKVKQADHKRTEQELLNPDLEVFSEKSQVYQIELILPILRLIGIVDVKGENVILTGEWEEFLKKDIFEIMRTVIHEVGEARSRRLNPPEVFTATEVPFYDKMIFDKVVKLIQGTHNINLHVIFSHVIRDHLIFSPGFQIKSFEEDLGLLRKEIQSAIFYLNLFGLLQVEYPNRNLNFSVLGRHFFLNENLTGQNEKGGITINSDFSIIAFPDRMSIYGIHLLKAFTELKDYDRVYTFLLTKDAYQLGILLGYGPSKFLEFLRSASKAELAQNLLFLLEDWGSNLPVVTITEESVLVRTAEAKSMELLLGQIKGKKMVLEEISPTGIIIDKNKVMEVIAIAEKLNLIIKLIR